MCRPGDSASRLELTEPFLQQVQPRPPAPWLLHPTWQLLRGHILPSRLPVHACAHRGYADPAVLRHLLHQLPHLRVLHGHVWPSHTGPSSPVITRCWDGEFQSLPLGRNNRRSAGGGHSPGAARCPKECILLTFGGCHLGLWADLLPRFWLHPSCDTGGATKLSMPPWQRSPRMPRCVAARGCSVTNCPTSCAWASAWGRRGACALARRPWRVSEEAPTAPCAARCCRRRSNSSPHTCGFSVVHGRGIRVRIFTVRRPLAPNQLGSGRASS